MIKGDSCKALEAGNTAFDLLGDGLMYLRISFNSVISKQMRDGYNNEEDDDGIVCLDRIHDKVNKTVTRFKQEMVEIQEDKLMLPVYIKHSGTVLKRSVTGGIALALGIFDLIATSTAYFYTDYRLRLLQEKVMEIDELISNMNEHNVILETNQNYLYKEGKTLGIHENILANHFNQLSHLHACDVVTLESRYEISEIENKLELLKKALVKGELNTDVISVKALRELTLLDEFRDTVYILAPLQLYQHAKLSLHSVDENGINFLIAYPKIGRETKYKIVSVLETTKNILIPRTGTELYFSFLLPVNVPLNETESHIDEIRNADSCFELNGFLACHPYSVLTAQTVDCLNELFIGKKSGFCFGKTSKKDVSFSLGGVLIETYGKAEIVDSQSGQILRSLDGHTCTYAEKHQDISVRFGRTVTPIFPRPLWVNSKHVFSAKMSKIFLQKVENVSLPQEQNPFPFRNLTAHHQHHIFHYLSNPLISGTIIVTFICSAIIFSLVVFCFSRCCGTANGGTNVRVDLGAVDGGAIGR